MARSSMDAMSQLIRYPAAERNKGPILEVLQRIFSTENWVRNVLEIGLLRVWCFDLFYRTFSII